MNANIVTNTSNNNHGPIVPEAFLEGLALETFVLESLLKRHRCNHGRTIYFRRMDMVLNRLLLAGVVPRGKRSMLVVTDAVHRLNDLQKDTIRYQNEERNRKSAGLKRRRRGGQVEEEEERWDIQSLLLHEKKSSEATGAGAGTARIAEKLQALIRVWTRTIPELLSRIQHASKALFKEVSRGFFLPFCTVALGALARIRALLMEIGVKGLTKLQELEFGLSETETETNQQQHREPKIKTMQTTTTTTTSITTSGGVYEHCMNLFVENESDNDVKRRAMLQSTANGSSTQKNTIVDRSAVLRSLGLMESTFTSTTKTNTHTNLKAARTRSTTDSEEMDDADSTSADATASALEEANGNGNGNRNRNGQQEKDSASKSTSTSVLKESSLLEKDDDYHTLATSALLGESRDEESVDDSIEKQQQSGTNRNSKHGDDSFDCNMALVDKFRKRKNKNEKQQQQQQQSNDSDKKKKKEMASAPETKYRSGEQDQRKKKRKSKTAKDPTKTKKKARKKKGGDFFDEIFG
mmetsp:Transcript_10783/g.22987  ORF Transcript_10783/g.22987 Transcript_10783/m.22987 type:complete len:523 (-) Transcript_10783:420-1988(-)